MGKKKKKFGSAYKIPGKCCNCNKPISYLEGTMPICAQCARQAFISEEEAFKRRVESRNIAVHLRTSATYGYLKGD